MKIDKNKILKILAENLSNHLIFIMKQSGKKITKKEAKNILSNIGLYLMNKNKDLLK